MAFVLGVLCWNNETFWALSWVESSPRPKIFDMEIEMETNDSVA